MASALQLGAPIAALFPVQRWLLAAANTQIGMLLS
jgi:hypothetical protein